MDLPQTYKILMVEDEELISNATKASLEVRNHSVTVIDDGLEALKVVETLKNDSCDVILLDINLPGANGFHILAKLKANKNTEGIPTIMLTAIDDDNTESHALLEGADDYIVKPCSTKVLLARIEANLRKKSEGKPVSKLDFDLPFTDGQFDEVTEREKEILGLVVKGYSNKEIAEKLVISNSTVVNHIRNIFVKLNVVSRLQAAVIALKYDLVVFNE